MRISSVPSGWPRVDTYTIATSSSGSIAAPISSSESRRFVSVAIGAVTSVRGLLTRTTERAAVPQRSSITRLRRLDVVAERVLGRVPGDADEVQVGDAGAPVLQRRQRVVEERRLHREHRLRRGARVARVGRGRRSPGVNHGSTGPKTGAKKIGHASSSPPATARYGRWTRRYSSATYTERTSTATIQTRSAVSTTTATPAGTSKRVHDTELASCRIGNDASTIVGIADRQRAVAVDEREDRGREQQESAGEHLVAQAVPGERGVGAEPQRVGAESARAPRRRRGRGARPGRRGTRAAAPAGTARAALPRRDRRGGRARARASSFHRLRVRGHEGADDVRVVGDHRAVLRARLEPVERARTRRVAAQRLADRRRELGRERGLDAQQRHRRVAMLAADLDARRPCGDRRRRRIATRRRGSSRCGRRACCARRRCRTPRPPSRRRCRRGRSRRPSRAAPRGRGPRRDRARRRRTRSARSSTPC